MAQSLCLSILCFLTVFYWEYNLLNILLAIVFPFAVLHFLSSIFILISFVRRGNKYGKIRITEDSFFYWDGWFEHQFKWVHINEIRANGAENNILKIFFKGIIQDYFRSPKSNNFIRNYCRKKLIDKNISIELKRFREKESLEIVMLEKKKIVL